MYLARPGVVWLTLQVWMCTGMPWALLSAILRAGFCQRLSALLCHFQYHTDTDSI